MKNLVRALLISTLAAFAWGSSAAALTISPAGSLSGTSGTTSISVNGITLTCGSSTFSGTVSTAGVGSISAMAYNTCRQASLGSFTITPLLPWSMSVTLTGGQVIIRWSESKNFSNIFGCRFTVTGSQTIVIPAPSLPANIVVVAPTAAGSALTVSGSTGCLGLVNNGNAVSLIGSWALATTQTVSG